VFLYLGRPAPVSIVIFLLFLLLLFDTVCKLYNNKSATNRSNGVWVLWLYERTCGDVERTRVPPGPDGTVHHGQYLFSVWSAVVRRRHGARHHPRAQSCHRVRRQGSRRSAADARSTVSFQRLTHHIHNI